MVFYNAFKMHLKNEVINSKFYIHLKWIVKIDN